MGMEMGTTREESQKVGEKWNEAVSKLEPAGDPSDFAQEAERTTAEHRSEAALDADDDRYPEGSADDTVGHEPGTLSPQQAEEQEKEQEKAAKAEPKARTTTKSTASES